MEIKMRANQIGTVKVSDDVVKICDVLGSFSIQIFTMAQCERDKLRGLLGKACEDLDVETEKEMQEDSLRKG